MHAGLGAQPAEGVIAGHEQGRALDARDFPGRSLDHLGREPAPLPPAQVHAKQHLRPVLRLGPPGPGLNVEKGIGGVHLLREHAPELEAHERRIPAIEILLDRAKHGRVFLVAGELQEIGRVEEPLADGGEHVHEVGELGAFPAQRPRAGGSPQTPGSSRWRSTSSSRACFDSKSKIPPKGRQASLQFLDTGEMSGELDGHGAGPVARRGRAMVAGAPAAVTGRGGVLRREAHPSAVRVSRASPTPPPAAPATPGPGRS